MHHVTFTQPHSSLQSTTPTDFAVLDIQWAPSQPDILAVAASTGLIAFYRLHATNHSLDHLASHAICPRSILVLSCTWHPIQPNCLGVTLSDGRIVLMNSTSAQPLWDPGATLTSREIHSHAPLEAWTLAFLPSTSTVPDTETILSGGDDAIFRASTLDSASTTRFVDRRIHGAGVTAILPLTDSLIVTGSYDDHIRLLAIPARGARGRILELARLNLGGGVWRLKLLSSSEGERSVVLFTRGSLRI